MGAILRGRKAASRQKNGLRGCETLGDNVLNDLTVDICKAEMPALELEGKLLVVDAQQVQDGGLKVMNVNLVVHGVEADIVRGSIGDAWFDATSSHPSGEGVGVVVAAPAFAVLHVALEEGCAAEFTTPDDKGLIEHAALFEVSD